MIPLSPFPLNPLKLGYTELSSNMGYYLNVLPPPIKRLLNNEVSLLKKDFSKGIKNNSKLAGEIKHEYVLNPTDPLIHYIQHSIGEFEDSSNYFENTYQNTKMNFSLDHLWINFQQKSEYNPIHRHSGVYSFVIWHTIPYYMKDEDSYSSKPIDSGQQCSNGRFNFIYSKNGDVQTLPLDIDKEYEGYIALFPSTLHHLVYPFYSSNDYRITISGNVRGHI